MCWWMGFRLGMSNAEGNQWGALSNRDLYIGKEVQRATMEVMDKPFRFDIDSLTKHAVCFNDGLGKDRVVRYASGGIESGRYSAHRD